MEETKRKLRHLHCSLISQVPLLEVLVRADDEGIGIDAHARSKPVERFHVRWLQLLVSATAKQLKEASKRSVCWLLIDPVSPFHNGSIWKIIRS